MTKMPSFKTLAGAGLIGAMAASAPAAHAADATITVDVDFPTVLVMYHFSQIDLTVADQAVADFLTGGTASDCTAGFCDDQGTFTAPSDITDLTAATADAGLDDTNPALNTVPPSVDFSVSNAVGVRALGCSTYGVTVTENAGTSAGVTVDTGSLSDIDGSSCSLSMTTGSLDFSVDLATITGDPSAIFDVSIIGNP